MLLGALVVYPIFFSVVRSLYDESGDNFVGVENYRTMFASERRRTAIKNNFIWVIFAPSIVTALGLIFAVLSERIRWGTAFKLIIFMPMAISFLAAGIICRLIYEEDPQLGLANAAARGVAGHRRAAGRDRRALGPPTRTSCNRRTAAYVTSRTSRPGDTAELGLVGDPAGAGSRRRRPAAAPADGRRRHRRHGVARLHARRRRREARRDRPDRARACPGVEVEAVQGGAVAGIGDHRPDGRFAHHRPGGRATTNCACRRRTSASRSPGSRGSGRPSSRPSIIVAYVWIWAGFAMVLIAAGLAAIPRDVLEAARVEGANEWQVFRRVTVPLLAPVLGVVLVTLVINVLKIFDLVLVIAPGSSQQNANVIALQMWKTAFGVRDFGVGQRAGRLPVPARDPRDGVQHPTIPGGAVMATATPARASPRSGQEPSHRPARSATGR